MTFKWSPEMEIDGGLIDQDHRKLISLANRVLELDRPNRDADELKLVIKELYLYVQSHFQREEELMEKIGYPDLKGHHEKHEFIINDMNKHLTSSHHMAEILSNFRNLVNKWVISHIMEEDKKIRQFMKKS